MNAQEYRTWIRNKAMEKKHPLNATFELTPLCTLACKMCYARLTHEEVAKAGGVLTTSQWLQIVDEAIEAGVYSITLTGGEAMLHPGFFEIYARAYDKGADVSLITNATLMNDEVISFLQDRPPANISVTIYGASPETYASLCGNAKAYETVMSNVRKLVSCRFRIGLQTTLTKENIGDILAIRSLASELDVPYAFNTHLSAGRNCSDQCVVESEVGAEERYQLISGIYEGFAQAQVKMLEAALDNEKKYLSVARKECLGMRCTAGNISFHINWKAEMTLCPMFDIFKINVFDKGLKQSWDEMVRYAGAIPQIPECQTCPHTGCTRCVAAHYLDTKEFGIRSPRLCPVLRHNEANRVE